MEKVEIFVKIIHDNFLGDLKRLECSPEKRYLESELYSPVIEEKTFPIEVKPKNGERFILNYPQFGVNFNEKEGRTIFAFIDVIDEQEDPDYGEQIICSFSEKYNEEDANDPLICKFEKAISRVNSESLYYPIKIIYNGDTYTIKYPQFGF